MLRKYPYKGWLLLSLLLWSATWYYFHLHRQAMLPERMAEAVDKNLRHREDIYEGYLLEHDWIRRMFADSLTDKELERVDGFPFFMFGFDNDSLKCWNNNVVIVPVTDSLPDTTLILRNDKGLFIEKIHQLGFLEGNKKLVTLFPVIIYYPVENDYLQSYFVASKYIPIKTRIIPPDKGTKDDYLITMRGNKKTFYLKFDTNEIQKWVPDIWCIGMLILSIFASVTWINLLIYSFKQHKKSRWGLIITLSIILVIRFSLYCFGLPFNLDTLDLFSPQLYASSNYLSSLGDLLIDTLLSLWLIVYLISATNYKSLLTTLKSPGLKLITAVVLMMLNIGYVFLFVSIIRSLVLDSNISLDVSHFYAINVYTLLGLFIIGALAGVTCLVIYLFNIQYNVLLSHKRLKYALILTLGTIIVLLSGNIGNTLPWILICWNLVFIAIIDNPNFALVADILKPQMIYWVVFICAFCAGILQYFNEIKEHETRKAYVINRLAPQRDDELEYSFDKTAKKIANDKLLQQFLSDPSYNVRKQVNQRFNNLYFTGNTYKYQTRLYLFDSAGRALFNKDSADYQQLLAEKNEATSSNSPYLFYKQASVDRHYYFSYIPVYEDSTQNVLGYVMINFDLKKTVAETVYPELMQTISGGPGIADNEYAYAVYIHGKLISQTNIYPFPVKLDNDTLPVQHYVFSKRADVLELFYKVSDQRTIVIMHYHSLSIELMTLFSYLFITLICLSIAIILYRLFLSFYLGNLQGRKSNQLTIQKRLHYAMLGIVFFSFLVIGVVTGIYFSSESEISNNNKLQTATQVARQSVQDYLQHYHAFDGENIFDSLSKSMAFKSFITNIANNQKVDINIFDTKGNLYATSQEDLYDKGLVSRKMRPEAFHKLHTEGTSIVIQNEKIGDLPYTSLYEPLRNENGTTFSYINVPFFSSKKDLNYQIYNIIVTFVYIYAFIFLISGLVTVSIAQWITRSFNIIIRQFENINLKLNERIEWPYDDEIGLLVQKYNEMVKKVEENAVILAQNEREGAWREMAKQIAHEIKNPLTPMKLNIQHLQQTIKNNETSPRIIDLTNKVTASIVEQIENLAYIASAFSDFAKMPEAKEEIINVNELLNKAITLYDNYQNLEIIFPVYALPVYIKCDKSQLLRVLNNLFENARQAIPENREGKIRVSMTTDQNYVTIAITDNGTGISDDVATKIFRPYFTTKSSGTGLGLAMTKKILEFWKGKIWYETCIPDGSTFYISLPEYKIPDTELLK